MVCWQVARVATPVATPGINSRPEAHFSSLLTAAQLSRWAPVQPGPEGTALHGGGCCAVSGPFRRRRPAERPRRRTRAGPRRTRARSRRRREKPRPLARGWAAARDIWLKMIKFSFETIATIHAKINIIGWSTTLRWNTAGEQGGNFH